MKFSLLFDDFILTDFDGKVKNKIEKNIKNDIYSEKIRIALKKIENIFIGLNDSSRDHVP